MSPRPWRRLPQAELVVVGRYSKPRTPWEPEATGSQKRERATFKTEVELVGVE